MLVEGTTERRSNMGRPSEMLRIASGGHHFLGVKLTGDALYASGTDLRADVVKTKEVPLRSHDVDDVVSQIAAVAAEFSAELPALTAIGLSLAGVIRKVPAPLTVMESAFLGWNAVPLTELVTAATGLPSFADNDVQALTSAEHLFGSRPGLDSMVLLTVGAGIGCGVISNGRLVEGAHGIPGRVSHLPVDAGGPLCGLGHRGCAASYLVNESIVGALGLPDTRDGYRTALERAHAGEPAAVRVVADAGTALGVIIGTVANMNDPQKILVTGEGLPLYNIATRQVREGIARVYEDDPAYIDLEVQPFDFDEWARSAAALAIRSMLTETGPKMIGTAQLSAGHSQ
ncbi:ROK family protein [Gryllotalpicola reticulitermitis]|uniref:ROK family protein n=1 Tax=Gryllotalpicola reticulitermitis TaxID=1184153 RepID=A0ABV8Q5T3_9MICO